MADAKATFADRVRLAPANATRATDVPGSVAQITPAWLTAVLPDMQKDYVCNDIMTRTAHAVSDLESIKAVNQA